MKTARQMADKVSEQCHIHHFKTGAWPSVTHIREIILGEIPIEALVKCAEACKAWIIAQDACKNAIESNREERILERKKAEMQMREALAVLERDI